MSGLIANGPLDRRVRGAVMKVSKTCESCGKTVEIYPSWAKDFHFCSWACRKNGSGFDKNKSKNWDGGNMVGWNGALMTRKNRKGYTARYIYDHRMIAAKAIGRELARYEAVIHIDGDKRNNAESNLFICGSESECGKRYSGALPWPVKSNLAEYANAPNVELTGAEHKGKD